MGRAFQLCFALGLFALMLTVGEGRKFDQESHLRTSVSVQPLQPVEASVSPNFVCDACVQFSTEAQIILSDPETQQHAVEILSQVACQSLVGKLKNRCLDLVGAYVTDAFVALQAYVGPEICTEAGLCLPEGLLEAKEQIRVPLEGLMRLGGAKTCVLCQGFAQDALSYLGRNATKAKIVEALHLACGKLEEISRECDLLVDIYAPELIEQIDDVTPEEICDIAHLCIPSVKTAVAVRKGGVGSGLRLKRNDCTICEYFVLELKLKLKDPVTQEKLLDVLLNGCTRVQNHVDECRMIVTQYAPFILANLDNILDADALCRKIGVCSARKVNGVASVLALYSDRARHGLKHVRAHKNVHFM